MSTAAEFSSQLKRAANGLHSSLPTIAHRPTERRLLCQRRFDAVLECHNEGLTSGITVRLISSNPMVVHPIALTKLDTILALYPTIEEALQGALSVQP
jgi:hypothetical protein